MKRLLAIALLSAFIPASAFGATAAELMATGMPAAQAVLLAQDALPASLIPDTDGTYDLGSSSKEWKDLYIDGVAYIDGFAQDALPNADGTLDLGSASLEWENLYVDGEAFIDSQDKLAIKDSTSTVRTIVELSSDNAYFYAPDIAGAAARITSLHSGSAVLLDPGGLSGVIVNVTTGGGITSNGTGDFDWTIQSGANTACTTTCTSPAVFGFDTGTNVLVGPGDATADTCICAGSS
jgi:hypothetical protein